MSEIIIRRRKRLKPIHHVRPRRNWPIHSWAIAGQSRYVVEAGNAPIAVDRDGLNVSFDSDSGDVRWPIRGACGPQYTIIAHVKVSHTTVDVRQVLTHDSSAGGAPGGNNRKLQLRFDYISNGNHSLRAIIFNTSGANFQPNVTGAGAGSVLHYLDEDFLNGFIVCVRVGDGTANVSAYRPNGTGGLISSDVAVTGTPRSLDEGLYTFNWAGPSNGIYAYTLFSDKLSEANCQRIARNYYGELFERSIWMPITAVAAGATASPGVGKALLSGKAPTVFAEKSTAPTTGTAIFSGLAPTTVTAVVATVQPATGAAVFSGLAPTTFRQVTQAPTTGTALFSGLAPTISAITGVGVSPTTGTALLSGLAPTTFREVTVSPTTGKITYSGVTPTVAAAKTVAPTTGTAIFSGLAPTVTTALLATVQPTTGAALLSGLAPTVSVQRTAAPGAGTAIFSGKAPETSVFVNLTPTTGTAIFSGLAPSAGPFIGTTVSPTVGKMTMTGKAPTATADSVFGVWNPIDEVSSSWIPYTRVTTAWTDL